ncbi:uncharacterized protein C8Q71DRAFT_718060 [Rhodofomes roseus]|uniref:BHLH domain-containing protein n=1 Tax=Rhodofomes roseus TaxID=34475 RepID=A0ABQ8JZ74_9APHY|nr:uncharacterized protein C8Q71DRAFT_718060 [Rhodofomes roseus]KAH9829600.1 hypothetical protein C8Q71DRAFT_718060 [Rhodofomes roseus]
MTGLKDANVPYTGSCNPPRRAKRPRTDTGNPTPGAAHDAASSRTPARRARPAILPKSPVPGTGSPDALDSDSGDEDDYEPDARATTQRRRGRKPGALSRSARESLRKLNHSRIEKARRTKINETLATLSALVSEADQEQAKDAGEKPGETKTKGRTEEKEFKLDVLVKTVVYVQGLIDKVRTLEAAADACLHCSRDRVAGSTPDLKRKRPAEQHANRDVDMTVNVDEEDEEDVEYAGDDEKGDGEPERDSPTGTLPDHSPALTATAAAASTSTRATISPRLPPIAAWLPHPYVDPSCIAAMSDSRAAATSQLPSPPLSGPFRAASSVAARDVPALALPAPAHPIEPVKRGANAPDERRPGAHSRSPTWTPEDETAASLLLQMSSSPASMRASSAPMSSASSVGTSAFALPKAMEAPARRMSMTRGGEQGLAKGESAKQSARMSVQAETPSSLLGLGR